jgi:ZIP Zinc transporter
MLTHALLSPLQIDEAAAASEGALVDAADHASVHWRQAMAGEESVVELRDGDTAKLSTHDVYSLSFEPASASTTVQLSGLRSSAYFAVFMEHLPSEFSAALLGPTGTLEQPVLDTAAGAPAEDTAGSSSDEAAAEPQSVLTSSQRWGLTFLATLAVSLIALVGILLAVLLTSLPELTMHNCISYANAFAVGALLTVSLVHLIPEGLAGLDSFGEGAGAAPQQLSYCFKKACFSTLI